MFMIQKIHYCYNVNAPQIDLETQWNRSQNPRSQQAVSKIHFKMKRIQIAKTNLKKNKIGILAVQDFKTYTVTIIKTEAIYEDCAF